MKTKEYLEKRLIYLKNKYTQLVIERDELIRLNSRKGRYNTKFLYFDSNDKDRKRYNEIDSNLNNIIININQIKQALFNHKYI